LAADSDELVLEEARCGLYSSFAFAKVPEAYRGYFRSTRAGCKIDGLEGGVIRYLRHNLLTDSIPGRFDVIVCRNLLICFERETRLGLLRRLTDALEPGGVYCSWGRLNRY